jgi:hypothetical protein
MTRMVGYAAVGAVLAVAAMCWSASAEPNYRADGLSGIGSRDLVTHFQAADTGPTALTLVDPQARVLAVYHIVRDTGEIQLKSVRNFGGDLSLDEFNTGGLTPEDVRQANQRNQ